MSAPPSGTTVAAGPREAAEAAALPFGVRHFGATLALALVLVLVVLVVGVGAGSTALSPAEVVRALLGQPDQPLHQIVVNDLRLPRVLIAAVAGATLALAGALTQSVTRNPLASPELTGVTAGVAFVSVLWLAYGPGQSPTAGQVPPGPLVPAVATVGGVGAGLVVYWLSRSREGRSDPLRLVLVGVLVSVLVQAATSFVVFLNQGAVGGVLVWYVGSLNARVWVHWAVLWPWALVAVVIALAAAGLVNVLQLGDDAAALLGVRVERARLGLLVLAALLTAGAIAVVGAIGFIGLIGPHIGRRIVGDDARRLLPFVLPVGALLLLGADVIARTATQPREIPAGAVTTFLGALFFVLLVRRGPR